MIYVAGKIRGLQNYEIPFLAAKEYLKKQGLNSVTAIELLNGINYKQLKENQIISYINNVIYECNSVYMIPNYIFSDGSKLELHLGKYYKKNIVIMNWSDLFDNEFLKDFQNFFEVSFKSRLDDKLIFKYLLIDYLKNFIHSSTTIGRLIYTSKSNSYSTVVNALNNVKFAIDGIQGIELQNEYLYKKELVEKYIRGYYES